VTGEPHQVLGDCRYCRVEAAVIELFDPAHPACHFGVPAEVWCRLCAWREVADGQDFVPRFPLGSGRCPACARPLPEAARDGGPCPACGCAPAVRRVAEPLDLRDPVRAAEALARWAAAEGESDPAVFCRANLGGDLDATVARLVAGAPVPTTFDVIAFLFPSGEAQGRGGSQRSVVDRAPEIAVPTERTARPVVEDLRAAARVLVSVMVADGELRAGERQFVERFLQTEGLPPFETDDLRVWRPGEVAGLPPAMRDKVLEAAIALAHLDRMRDGSEWKVIESYARAWGVPPARLRALDTRYDARYGTLMTRLFRLLSNLVRLH
jgi:tellurite resistance protein